MLRGADMSNGPDLLFLGKLGPQTRKSKHARYCEHLPPVSWYVFLTYNAVLLYQQRNPENKSSPKYIVYLLILNLHPTNLHSLPR